MTKKKIPHIDDVKLDEEVEKVGEGDVKEGMTQDRDPSPIIKKKEINFLDAALEKQVTHLGRETARKLKKYPTEKVMIPKDKLNKRDSYVVVGINGWNFQIRRETPVELPIPVIKLLEVGGYYPTRVR